MRVQVHIVLEQENLLLRFRRPYLPQTAKQLKKILFPILCSRYERLSGMPPIFYQALINEMDRGGLCYARKQIEVFVIIQLKGQIEAS